ncbi:MAG: hypothetical protein K5779_06175 [Saccharofermentans sp.]|nr:hypothetical protein [Saccharofermentans sp.]
MRVNFRRKNKMVAVIEIVQMIRYDTETVGLVLPYTKHHEKRDYDCFESTEKVDETDYNYWCEQLVRNGYLDLSRTKYVFRTGKV